MQGKLFILLLLMVTHFLYTRDAQIRALIDSLSIDQKIGQLFMITAVVDETINHALKPYRVDKEYVQWLIKEYHIGGIIWLGQGIPEAQKERSRELREYSSIPLWFGQDLEPSFLARFGFGTVSNAREIGQKDDVAYTFEIGKKIGTIAAAHDVRLILAPVVDIHYFDESPITKNRSFGSSGELVTKHAAAFIDGVLAANKYAIPCIKHFPGHGQTVRDSHYELPTVDTTTDEMLFPFEQLLKIYKNCAVMVGHIAVKDCNEQLPATLNSLLIDMIKKYNDNTLIVTDALDMRALQEFENKEVQALNAGCHLLLCPLDVPKAVSQIKHALMDGVLSIDTIDNAVEKIMRLKFCH
jgi:beta-N-acetylhexosaminidase